MRNVVLILMVIGVVLVNLAIQKRAQSVRRVARGLIISYLTILVILFAGEIYFRFFYAESENIYTLSTQNWLDRYYQANSLGFRDREWKLEDYTGKKTVLVLGDSLAVGWGIPNPADRFSDVLAQKLGGDYAVMNLAIYGTATPEQLDILKQYPVQQPNVVILQYFLNDINYAGLKLGLLPAPKPTPDWINDSYLANFLYWRLIVPADPDSLIFQDWWQWSYTAYDNVGIWSIHKQEIKEFVDYVNSTGARLIVVIFPNLLDPFHSIPYVDRVAQAFEEYGQHDILKLFDAAAKWDPNDLMVSRRDSHPSISFHHYVGETLYEQFFAEDKP